MMLELQPRVVDTRLRETSIFSIRVTAATSAVGMNIRRNKSTEVLKGSLLSSDAVASLRSLPVNRNQVMAIYMLIPPEMRP